MTPEDLMQSALEIGFTHAGPLNVEALVPLQEVRDMCAADKCRNYGKNWACPPGCGTLDEARELFSKYHRGILVQTVVQMRHEFDMRPVIAALGEQQEKIEKLTYIARETWPDCLPLGAGACKHCKKCTYPDEPCRFPEKRIVSIEAYGVVATDACRKSGMPYDYGPKTTTYICGILLD